MKLLEKVRIRALETAEKLALRTAKRRRRAGLPRVVETSTTRWYRANRAELEEGGIRFVPLPHPESYKTPLPVCLNGTPPKSWDWAVDWKPDERFYLEIPDGRLVFEPWRCAAAVITPGGTILHDVIPIFFHSAAQHPVRNAVMLGEPHRLKGRVFLLLNDAGSNFYHWMCDILPRLHVAQLAGEDIGSFDWFVTDEINQAFQRETLAAFGIPPEKLVFNTRHRHLAADVLCATSLFDRSGMVHTEALAFVRDAMHRHFQVPPANDRPRRVFITRQQAHARRIRNWEAVEPVLRDFGFEIIASENLTLAEQVALFGEAAHVIGAHGAGLANLLHCPPGTRVLEILNDSWGHSMYWLMANRLGLDYTLMKAESAHVRAAESDDMIVDPAPLRVYLEEIYRK